jgi:rsbT co-antagonist protein RsbR
MTDAAKSALPSLISRHEKDILDEWVKLQVPSETHRSDLVTEKDVRNESQRFLEATRKAIAGGTDVRTAEWEDVRGLLTELSQSRARQGFSPAETATFVLSLKQPLFTRLRTELAKYP